MNWFFLFIREIFRTPQNKKAAFIEAAVRYLAESNRTNRFCRPGTKPLIQGTNIAPVISKAGAKVQQIIQIRKYFCKKM